MKLSCISSLTHSAWRDAWRDHTHPFNDPLPGTTQVSRYRKRKTNVDFTEARHSERQWHQLGHMQVCTSLQTDNHASNSPLSFYGPDALPAAQPTASKHWRDFFPYSTAVDFCSARPVSNFRVEIFIADVEGEIRFAGCYQLVALFIDESVLNEPRWNLPNHTNWFKRRRCNRRT